MCDKCNDTGRVSCEHRGPLDSYDQTDCLLPDDQRPLGEYCPAYDSDNECTVPCPECVEAGEPEKESLETAYSRVWAENQVVTAERDNAEGRLKEIRKIVADDTAAVGNPEQLCNEILDIIDRP